MHLIPLPLPRPMRATDDTTTLPSPNQRWPSGPLPLSALAGRHVVIEEHLDGADIDLAFDARGTLLLGADGHPLAGGFGDRSSIPLRLWAMAHERRLIERLDDRHDLRGSWSYAMRRVWYDRLPHYFNATDVFDRATGEWLSTPRREALLAGSPVLSVPVLHAGPIPADVGALTRLGARSLAKSVVWREAFGAATRRESLPSNPWWRWVERSDQPFALIVKVEDERRVLGRYLLALPTRESPADSPSTMPAMLDGVGDLARRPLLPNALSPGADLFADQPRVTWSELGARPAIPLVGALAVQRPRGFTAGKSTGTSKATFTSSESEP